MIKKSLLRTAWHVCVFCLVCFGTLLASSCMDSDDVGDAYKTIVGQTAAEYLQAEPELTMFAEALQSDSLLSTLASYGKYTIFAPTNDAINEFIVEKGYSSFEELKADKEKLDEMLRYHIIDGEANSANAYFSTSFKDKEEIATKNMENRYIYTSISEDGASWSVSGANIIKRDQSVINGVIHTVDKVVQGSNATLAGFIASNANFTIYAEALKATGITDSLTKTQDDTYKYVKGMNYPEQKLIGFTALLEPDSVLALNGITDIASMREKAKALYPKAIATDDKNKKNSVTTIEEVRRRALRNEFGGIGEAFYDLYAITHDEATLRNAQFFYHNEKVDPLYASNYEMGTQHCNTFLPKMAAEMKSYKLGVGQNPHADVKGSQFNMVNGFWHSIVANHVYAPGCLSDKEHFFDPKTTSKHLTGNTGETCCTYNLLKLTRELYSINPSDPNYFDYYERALYNHILGQQDPETGMVHYFLPTQTGAYKMYSTYDRSFWCCVGSSFESHAKYAESIYWHSPSNDTIYINLFIASTLSVDGLTLKMHTDFPYNNKVGMVIDTDHPFVLMVRQPSWTGRTGYKTYRIKRGQRTIDFSLPMSLHTEATPDNPSRIALFYGPILLAGQLGTEGISEGNMQTGCGFFSNPQNHNDYYGFDYKVPEHLKSVKLDMESLRHIGPLEWITADGIKIKPLYDTHRQRYVVYWN